MDLKLKILQEHANKNGDLCEVYRHTDLYDGEATTILAAMDELSKIVAIAFAEWTSNYQWQYLSWGGGKPSGWHKGNYYNTTPITTNALYNLFTQSKEYKELMDGK